MKNRICKEVTIPFQTNMVCKTYGPQNRIRKNIQSPSSENRVTPDCVFHQFLSGKKLEVSIRTTLYIDYRYHILIFGGQAVAEINSCSLITILSFLKGYMVTQVKFLFCSLTSLDCQPALSDRRDMKTLYFKSCFIWVSQ